MLLCLQPACSSSDHTVAPSLIPNGTLNSSIPQDTTHYGNHFLLFAGHLAFSRENATISLIPDRSAEQHWNVTSLIIAPKCPDCLGINVDYIDIDAGLIGVNVSLRNPTSVTAYDIRAIVMPDNDGPDTGVRLLNSDAYTPLWDNGGDVQVNPFIAYGKSNENRAFPGGYEEELLLQFSFNDILDLTFIPFAIDASFPGNCDEPFDLTISTSGSLYTDSSGILEFSVILNSWLNDGEEVWIDLSPLGGVEKFQLTEKTGWSEPYSQMFEGDITGLTGVNAGTYEIWLSGKSSGSETITLDRLDLHVYESGEIGWDNVKLEATFNIDGSLLETSQFGNRLSVASYNGLLIYDVSDPSDPNLRQVVDYYEYSGTTPTGFPTDNVIDNGEFIAVSNNLSGVQVYRAATIGHEDRVVWFDPDDEDFTWLMGCHNNFLFVAEGNDIYTLDLSDLDAPVPSGPFPLDKPPGYFTSSDWPKRLFSDDIYFEINHYKNEHEYRLFAWQVPETPGPLVLLCDATIPTSATGSIGNMFIKDEYLIVNATGSEVSGALPGFYVFNISDLSNPVFVKQIHSYDPNVAYSSFLWLVPLYDDIYYSRIGRIIDLSQLPDITILGNTPDSDLKNPAFAGSDPSRKLVYACHFEPWTGESSGLYVLDSSDLDYFNTIGYSVLGWPDSGLYNLEIDSDDRAYCSWLVDGLVTFDFSDPEHPSDVSVLKTPDWAMDVWPENGYAYVACRGSGLVVVNCQDPLHPQLVTTLPTSLNATTVTGTPNFIFLGCGWSEIQILNISQPDNPVPVSTYKDTEEPIRYFDVDGEWLYYRTDNYLCRLDISDIYNLPAPERVFAGVTNYRLGLSAENGLVLHESDGHAVLRDLNIHALTDPPVAEFPGEEGMLRIFNHYAFISNPPSGSGTVFTGIYDIIDPANPEKLFYLTSSGNEYYSSAYLRGNACILPSGSEGIEIVSLW